MKRIYRHGTKRGDRFYAREEARAAVKAAEWFARSDDERASFRAVFERGRAESPLTWTEDKSYSTFGWQPLPFASTSPDDLTEGQRETIRGTLAIRAQLVERARISRLAYEAPPGAAGEAARERERAAAREDLRHWCGPR